MEDVLKKMKKASYSLATMSTEQKNDALKAIAESLKENAEAIIAENNKDLEKAAQDNLAMPLLKRLKFDRNKLNGVVDGIYDVIKLDDPANKTLDKLLMDDGLVLTKVSVPIGVIGVIFESRPDALVQIACLCLKSGNCAILKGGSEAANTNRILTAKIVEAVCNVSSEFENTIYLLETRADVATMLQYSRYINLIIPRGSNEFVQYIQKNSLIPVLGHADGICHVYVDKEADLDKAVSIAFDSKTQYVAVCNAMETLLVHRGIAEEFLPLIKEKMKEKDVVLKGCEATRKILPGIEAAGEEDWKTEYLDYIVSIKIVDSAEEAIDHINSYGSGHTDAIVTENKTAASLFTSLVDSASAVVNASTRFADGFRYGMGAEVGISTNKIHARGPVGLEGLVIYKFILQGEGQIVADYSEGRKSFIHKKL